MSRTLQPPTPFRVRLALMVGRNEATGEIHAGRPSPQPWPPIRASFPTAERVQSVRGFGSFTGLYRLSGVSDVVFYYLVQEGPRTLAVQDETGGVA